LPLDGIFIFSGAAPEIVRQQFTGLDLHLLPPSSRKFCGDPEVPPVFVDARDPSKYGSRLTEVPL